MLAGVVAAIMVLAPAKVADAAVLYADSIMRQASDQNMDPLLVVSMIHVETGGRWENTLISKTHDYGLMQVHVSRTTNATYVGRESELFDPDTNILVGIQLLTYWKRYHTKKCKSTHRWWAHYKWGIDVKNDSYSKKIARVYKRVKHISLLAQEGEIDHCLRRIGRLRKGNTSSCHISSTAAIDSNIVPEVRGSFWSANSGAPEGAGSVLSERAGIGDVVAITRRRRSLPGPDDDGQVRRCIRN